MNTAGKIGVQVGLVLLAGGTLLLTGGVAAALPDRTGAASEAPPGARAECAVVQLPGMDLQLSEPGACISVLMPPSVGAASAPLPATAPSSVPVGSLSPPVPAADAAAPVGAVSPPAPVGNASPPVSRLGLPYPCLDVQLPGIRISVGDASPPTQCFVAPTV